MNEERILSIDYGLTRTGLAISIPIINKARPLKTITEKDSDKLINKIIEISNENKVTKILVGLPLKMDETYSDMTKKAEIFINSLKKKINLPIITINEVLSTFEAEEILREFYNKKCKFTKDELAATIILQSFLNHY